MSDSDPKLIIPDLDPANNFRSDRIRIHNTDFVAWSKIYLVLNIIFRGTVPTCEGSAGVPLICFCLLQSMPIAHDPYPNQINSGTGSENFRSEQMVRIHNPEKS